MRRKMGLADIGRALGISRQRVHVLAKRGMPVDDIEKARQWRSEHLDADTMKPDPHARRLAADPTTAELKLRMLTAEVLLLEERAKNAGSVTLPSAAVERGLIYGLQMLRGSVDNGESHMYASMVPLIGEEHTREVLDMVGRWWGAIYSAACDGILIGFQRELPVWGRDFHARWVQRARGNFPMGLAPPSRARSMTLRPATRGNLRGCRLRRWLMAMPDAALRFAVRCCPAIKFAAKFEIENNACVTAPRVSRVSAGEER